MRENHTWGNTEKERERDETLYGSIHRNFINVFETIFKDTLWFIRTYLEATDVENHFACATVS